MLKSKARRRLALKTSALSLAGTLALFASALLPLGSPPAEAAVMADQSMIVNFTCTGSGPFTGTDTVQAKITTPDSVATGTTTVPVKWEFAAMKPTRALTAQTRISIAGDLAVTGGTLTVLPVDQEYTLTAGVAVGASAPIPAKTENIEVASGATSVVVKPVATVESLELVVTVNTAEETSMCTAGTATPASLTTTFGAGGGTGTEVIVNYKCTSTGATEQNVKITTTLAPPATASVNAVMNINWTGTYVAGSELKAPATGLTTGAKLFAAATLTGVTVATPPAGEGTLGTITAGANIPLPTTAVVLKATPSTAGTATIKPGDLKFGGTVTAPVITCVVQNAAALKSYTVTVGGASNTPSPTATTTSTPTPSRTRTVFETVTQTPVGGETTNKVKTPDGGAETGAGGELGPDGRMFVMTGSMLVIAAGVGGLFLRRRTSSRG